jgi:predicted phosphodiesterase
MKIALISDIHANFEAFKAVLADMQSFAIDKTVCLGDCIGYGPEPEAVMAEIRRRAIPTIMGNHELGVCSSGQLNWFNPLARESI